MVFSDGTVLPPLGSTFNNNGKTSKQTGSFAAYVILLLIYTEQDLIKH
jgi:hypothetical protein